MCFDLDSHPPITPVAGGALDGTSVVLTASDGTRFHAFHARAAEPTGAGIVILPDVRGLHPFFEELALRFAEVGVDAVSIDYFGRSTELDTPRGDTFEHMPHMEQVTWDGLQADIRAAADILRGSDGRVSSLFVTGFCFGGRLAWDAATLGLGLAGVIGFYGRPLGEHASGMPAPVDVAGSMQGDVLGLFGGADHGIPADAIAALEDALTTAGVPHRLISYDGAPHSFFDRKQEEFAEASAAAWNEVLGFIRERTA